MWVTVCLCACCCVHDVRDMTFVDMCVLWMCFDICVCVFVVCCPVMRTVIARVVFMYMLCAYVLFVSIYMYVFVCVMFAISALCAYVYDVSVHMCCVYVVCVFCECVLYVIVVCVLYMLGCVSVLVCLMCM